MIGTLSTLYTLNTTLIKCFTDIKNLNLIFALY